MRQLNVWIANMDNRYKDREDAGEVLAELLRQKAYPDPVVLALPRGGVPLASIVAKKLNAPLDLILVRKIGLPGQQAAWRLFCFVHFPCRRFLRRYEFRHQIF